MCTSLVENPQVQQLHNFVRPQYWDQKLTNECNFLLEPYLKNIFNNTEFSKRIRTRARSMAMDRIERKMPKHGDLLNIKRARFNNGRTEILISDPQNGYSFWYRINDTLEGPNGQILVHPCLNTDSKPSGRIYLDYGEETHPDDKIESIKTQGSILKHHRMWCQGKPEILKKAQGYCEVQRSAKPHKKVQFREEIVRI
jgi:hypothetical protein